MSAKIGKKGKGFEQEEDQVQLSGGKKAGRQEQIGKLVGEDLQVHDVEHSVEQTDGSKPNAARMSKL